MCESVHAQPPRPQCRARRLANEVASVASLALGGISRNSCVVFKRSLSFGGCFLVRGVRSAFFRLLGAREAALLKLLVLRRRLLSKGDVAIAIVNTSIRFVFILGLLF